MNSEQLEEIEKLAVDFKSAAFHDMMACQTIPLVKALREAWAQHDEAQEQIKVLSAYSGERHAFYQTADGNVSGLVADKDGPWVRACDARTTEKERDEALAEVERLKALAREAIDFAEELSGAAPGEYYSEQEYAKLKELMARKP